MDNVVQNNGENALVVFTHPHHEDLVAPRDDGLAFFRGMPVEGTNFEAVTLGPDLKDDLKVRRAYAKHFMIGQVIARETYNYAMIFANTSVLTRDTWYFVRRDGRAKERTFFKKSIHAIRELTMMMRIIELLTIYHQHRKPNVKLVNPGTGLAIVCAVLSFLVDDDVVAAVLMACSVGHMAILYSPVVYHLFLSLILRKADAKVKKIRGLVKDGGGTKADANALDGFVFRLLALAVPKEDGFVTIYL